MRPLSRLWIVCLPVPVWFPSTHLWAKFIVKNKHLAPRVSAALLKLTNEFTLDSADSLEALFPEITLDVMVGDATTCVPGH